MRTRFSLAEIVRRVVERTHLVEFALTRPDGDQGAANLLAIVDQARLFAAAGGGGLRPFIRHLRDSMAEEQIEIEATVAEETDDVVRIMTIHGAKGLEYPIVALANLGARNQNHAQPVPREQERFLHFRVGAGSAGRHGHFKTPGYDDAWEQEKQYVEAERLRLLYVAATRAREHLIVPCVTGILTASGLLASLAHNLPEDRKLVDEIRLDELELAADRELEPIARSRRRRPPVAGSPSARRGWPSSKRSRLAAHRREIAIASSPRARARAARGRGRHLRRRARDRPGTADPDRRRRPHGDGARHAPGAHDLEQIADDVCKEGAITEDTADVISMCRACLDSPSVQARHRARQLVARGAVHDQPRPRRRDPPRRAAHQRPRRPRLPRRRRARRRRLQVVHP